MKETTIVTDVLVPEREFVAEYTANNPVKLMGVMLETMKKVWRVSSSKSYTDKIKWDVTGEKNEFYGEWRGRDVKDSRTNVWIRIIVQGAQDKKTKDGTVTIKVKSMMETKIEYGNPLDQMVRYVFVNTFYKDQLKKYIEVAKKRINDFDTEMRLMLGIGEREAGSLPASRM